MANLWRKAEENQKKVDKGAHPDDVEMAHLAETAGWTYLREHIDKLKEGIDLKLAEGVAGGQSTESIGQATILAVMAKQLLDSIVNKVEDAEAAVEEIKDAKNTGESE